LAAPFRSRQPLGGIAMAMFIWGEKEVFKRLGFVADFCPLCRDLRTFEVSRIGIAGHIYYITLVEGRFAGYRMVCQVCGTAYQADPEIYAKLNERALPPLQLAQATFPNWRKYHAARLALERALADPFAKISAQQRAMLIREPFRLLGPRVEKRFGQAFTMDGPTVATIAAAIVAIALADWGLREWMPAYWQEIEAGVVALGMAAVVLQLSLARGRYFRNRIFPIIVPALRPLRPKREELEEVVKELKKLRAMIARKIDVEALLEALQTSPAPAAKAFEDPECETRLDLAAAYLEMGDHGGARSLLAEVMDAVEASATQKDRARQMTLKAREP
jgi:FimV-like protein